MTKGKSVGVGKFVTDKERSTTHRNKMDKELPKKPEPKRQKSALGQTASGRTKA